MTQEGTNHALERQAKQIAIIQRTVADHFGIPITIMTAIRGIEPGVTHRQTAMHLTREITKASFPDIAKAFGQAHHKTAQHAHEAIPNKAQTDPELKKTIALLKKKASAEIAANETPKGDWKAAMVTREAFPV